MTREEREDAINWFEMLKEKFAHTEFELYLSEAIEALQQETKDTWSIKEVADTFKKHGLIKEQQPCEIHLTCTDEEIAKSFIEDVGAVKDLLPQPKIGHWRHYEGMLICSECGAEFYDDIMEYCGDDVPKRCPDCGAKMESEEK